MEFVERHVVLPEGSPGPECYERYYRFVEGEELAALVPSMRNTNRRLLTAHYYPVREPHTDRKSRIVWVQNEKDMPTIHDGGCSQIGVSYLAGDPSEHIVAMCSFNIAGEVPEKVEPFSC